MVMDDISLAMGRIEARLDSICARLAIIEECHQFQGRTVWARLIDIGAALLGAYLLLWVGLK